MSTALTFDPEAHAYTLDGVLIPSVTQVLSFGRDLSRIPEWTALRGTAFHLCTEYDDLGELDEDSVDPLVRPHLDAYRAWKQSARPTYLATELRVWGELDGLKFAGTIDRVATIGQAVRIMDLKSGAPRKEHGAQLAAYEVAYVQRIPAGEVPNGRLGVYCTKDGKWAERRYDGGVYLEDFRRKLGEWHEANGG